MKGSRLCYTVDRRDARAFRCHVSLCIGVMCLLLVGCGGGNERDTGSAFANETRTFSGESNNLEHAEMGRADGQLLRLAPESYEDGISSPSGTTRPNPRDISNLVFAQHQSTPSFLGLSGMAWLWGQFLDHDIDLTPEMDPVEHFHIQIPSGDQFFDPNGAGASTLEMHRSIYDESTGNSTESPRQQKNMISAWIDASNVYGSNEERARWLRSFEGGKLRTSGNGMLPFNDGSQDNAGGRRPDLFVAGDIRANENVALTAMHTLWVREHNRLAEEIAHNHPLWSDEQLYQRARKFVGAFVQSISFNEFLPALLGPEALERYAGYNPEVSGQILNEFSTAVYRVGHSMVHSTLLRLDEAGESIPQGPLGLRDAFFQPHRLITEGGIDPLLRGMAAQVMEEIDTAVVDDLRSFLFGRPGAGGLDLVCLNIQRGRDHGLADYNTFRESLGLARIESFSQITSNQELAAVLEGLYGTVDDIDLWVGALAEDHLPQSNVGETIGVTLALQFQNLRDGDRFWYENDDAFSQHDKESISRTRLSDVIKRNTQVKRIQENVFLISPDTF